MKKYLLVFMMMLLTSTVSAHDIEVKNADDVTIYYNYINEGTELEVTFRGDEECYECYYEYSGNVVIPEEVNYMGRILKVTSIGEYTFWHCDITSVTIPNSVTNIGDFAFDMCNRMTSVTIPNSVTSIGIYAFERCSRLTSVTIGNSVTSIGDHAFYYCTRMTSVSIGNSVTSIGDLAFCNCNRLTSVTIPNSVTSIGNSAFRECSGLTSVTIGNSVTSIGEWAFKDCSGLTSVTIPNSVTSIGDNAFYCENLTTVVSLIENPLTITWYVSLPVAGHRAIAFSQNTFMNGTLYVPKGTKFAYEAKEGWKDFRNIVEGTPTSIKRVTLDKETPNTPIYDLNGKRLSEPQKGINIIEGKKIFFR